MPRFVISRVNATPSNRLIHQPPRNRFRYAVSVALVIALGLLWRSPMLILPPFITKYGGDALWAIVVFLTFGFIFARASTVRIAFLSLAFAWSIEFLQLYHAPWIDSLRAIRLGHLILGSTFNAPDLLAYAFGIALGTLAEALLKRNRDISTPQTIATLPPQ